MRRLISWLIMLPAALGVVVFALNNKDTVVLNLWPFAMVIEMELYLVLTIVLGAGVVLGGVTSWAGAGRLRSELRKQSYAGEVSRRQLKTEREKSAKLEAELKILSLQQTEATTKMPGDDAKMIDHASTSSSTVHLAKPQTAA